MEENLKLLLTETYESLKNWKKCMYLFIISSHFKFPSFNLELFSAEQISAMYCNERSILLYNSFLEVDLYNICSLIALLWEFILSCYLEYFKDIFDDTQFKSNCTIMQCWWTKECQQTNIFYGGAKLIFIVVILILFSSLYILFRFLMQK